MTYAQIFMYLSADVVGSARDPSTGKQIAKYSTVEEAHAAMEQRRREPN